MLGIAISGSICLPMLVLLSSGLRILASPVGTSGALVAQLPADLPLGASPVKEIDSSADGLDSLTQEVRPLDELRSPRSSAASHIVVKPRMAVSEPLQLQELTPDELFKTMVIYDTQKLTSAKPMRAAHEPLNVGAAAARGRGGWSAYKLPDHFEFPGLTTRDYLVTFDKARPSVQLPMDVSDLYESVQSYAFNKYYVALTANHEASHVKGGELLSDKLPASWMDQVKPRTRAITTSQVTKNGLTAILKTRQWAAQIRKARPGLLDEEAVEESLARTWKLWIFGMKEATGHAYIPVQEIASKIHRR